MLQTLIAIIVVGVLVGLSKLANERFRNEARLPMQWGLNGTVNWTAKRVLALSVVPALATCILAATVISTLVLQPRPGQEGMEVPVTIMVGLGFVGVHALHLWLIERTLNRED